MTRLADQITAIILTYNEEDNIARTLDQLTWARQVLIVDSGSIDDTLEIVRRFDDPRIRLLVNETNRGAEAAWNRLLAEATGRFVKLLCCDDLLYPDCLALQAAVLESPAHAAVSIVAGPRDIVDESGAIDMCDATLNFRLGLDTAACVARSAMFAGTAGVRLTGESGVEMGRGAPSVEYTMHSSPSTSAVGPPAGASSGFFATAYERVSGREQNSMKAW